MAKEGVGVGPYVWNPFGSGSSSGYIPLPVLKLKGTMASDARKRADENTEKVRGGADVL